GNYIVELNVVANNGCANYVRDTISVFDAPIPSMGLPASNLCSNSPLFFANNTTVDPQAPVSYNWNFNNEITSANFQEVINFPSPGIKDITLEASIPGCITSTSSQITVAEGANTSFQAPNICLNLQTPFTNLTTGTGITGYQWDLGDGNFSALQNVNHTYAQPGTYFVSLETTNDQGCVTFQNQEVIVHDLPTPNFNFDVACEGTPTQFTDLSQVQNANLSTWKWLDVASNTTLSDLQNFSYTFTNTYGYNVRLVVASEFGCKDSLEQVVTVKEAPIVNFSYDDLCLNQTTNFVANVTAPSGENINTYYWQYDNKSSLQTNPTYQFTKAGLYSVSLTATASNLCAATFFRDLSVYSAPNIQISPESFCTATPLSVTDQTDYKGDVGIDWELKMGNIIANKSNPQLTILNSGQYGRTNMVTTDNGCTYSQTDIVTFFSPEQIKPMAFPDMGAAPLIVDFTLDNQGITAVEWEFEPSQVSSEISPQYTFLQDGNYNVQVTGIDQNGCISSAGLIVQAVNPLLDLAIDTAFISNDVVYLKLVNLGNTRIEDVQVSTFWGSTVETAQNLPVLLYANGTGQNSTILDLPNTISNPGNLEYVCLEAVDLVSTWADVNLENNRFCFPVKKENIIPTPYPNPVDKMLSLQVIHSDSAPVSIQMISTTGQLIYDFSTKNLPYGENVLEFPVESLANGVYFLKVTSGDASKLFRILVSHL
ncbi:MAG: PKD domain-containing protein, partial [Cyclobacteriaceae bacterium]|nr:PKD domain-containing protein [Cyclobacteriaceae bacterium]